MLHTDSHRRDIPLTVHTASTADGGESLHHTPGHQRLSTLLTTLMMMMNQRTSSLHRDKEQE